MIKTNLYSAFSLMPQTMIMYSMTFSKIQSSNQPRAEQGHKTNAINNLFKGRLMTLNRQFF